MTRWEYYVDRPPVEFDRLGRQGWELVAVDNGVAYFKRPNGTAEQERTPRTTVLDVARRRRTTPAR